MPDSNWKQLKGDDAKVRETEYGTPKAFSGWDHDKDLDPPFKFQSYLEWIDSTTGKVDKIPINWWIATKTDTFTHFSPHQGLEPPAAIPVTQFCDRCGKHSDSLVHGASMLPIPVPYSETHVMPGSYGHRNGTLYMRYRVRGHILRRTVRVQLTEKAKDAGGTVETVEKEMGAAKWERKLIDHIEQGPYVHWRTKMFTKDCKTGVSQSSFGYHESDIVDELVAALRESGYGESVSLLNDGEAIAEVAVAAAELPNPMFSLVAAEVGEGLEVDLVNMGEDGETTVHGRLNISYHKGGFMNVIRWKKITDAS